MNKETNFYHKKLEELGEKVVKDEIIGTSHLYTFSCGCIRVYAVNRLSLKAEESLYPCEKHKTLKELEA